MLGTVPFSQNIFCIRPQADALADSTAVSLELIRHPSARARATMAASMAVADTTAVREVEDIAEALVRI